MEKIVKSVLLVDGESKIKVTLHVDESEVEVEVGNDFDSILMTRDQLDAVYEAAIELMDQDLPIEEEEEEPEEIVIPGRKK